MRERTLRDDESREGNVATRHRTADGGRDPRTDRVVETGVDREAQHDEYGGFNFGAAFFGWLVAIGVAALLTAL